MKLHPGDVVAAFSPTASKRKYHLCVVEGGDVAAAKLLFINSEPKYPSDLILADGDIEGLPPSRTGKTVISFSDIVRFSERQLELFRAERVSVIAEHVIEAVCEHTRGVRTLTRVQKREILAAFGRE